jgi:hypothetical protein
MGMEPHFNLWNYFFRIRLWQSLGMEVAVWGAMWISASGLGKESTRTSPSPCPTSHSRLTILPLNPAGGMVWLGGKSASDKPYAMLFTSCNKLG